MAKEVKKNKESNKYKAVNPKLFAESYNDRTPFYKELSNGDSVELDSKNKHTINLLDNKIIIKE